MSKTRIVLSMATNESIHVRLGGEMPFALPYCAYRSSYVMR